MAEQVKQTKRKLEAINKVEGVCVCLPVGMVVQGCGLRIGPDPATLAQSSPHPELHHWPHYPEKHAHTYTHINTHRTLELSTGTDKSLNKKKRTFLNYYRIKVNIYKIITNVSIKGNY